MMRRFIALGLLLGLCGCAGIPFPPFGDPAAASAAQLPGTPIAVEVELGSSGGETKSTEAVLRTVLDAYSHVPLEPILRIETQAHLRAIHALAMAPRGKELEIGRAHV